MSARAAVVFVGLSLVAVAAIAVSRSYEADTQGDGVDWPDDEPADLLLLPGIENLGDMVTGAFVQQQTMSGEGLTLLIRFEGFSATPYADYKGNSIGYGHLMKPGENFQYVTPDQAALLLAGDVAWAERAVRTSVAVPLSQNQFDALVSLAYNIGETAFKKSTLVRMINAGDYSGAVEQFYRWNRAGGQVNEALEARRAQEADYFAGGIA